MIVGQAGAVTIEIDDVAPDRVERQRAFAAGALPLPNTPSLGQFESRLASAGLKLGDSVFIRIFKAESELEVWMKKGDAFILFSTYPICHWAGTLGPKLKEGDKQNPEGFYSVGPHQLHHVGRWPRSLNIGFPNTYDRAQGRTGSYLLVHGGCSSVGCYAMTNAVMDEIYSVTEKALKNGQQQIEIHIFPFRMTEANLHRFADSPWIEFWRTLKQGYDAFEQTRVPPRIGMCEKSYVVEAVAPGELAEARPVRFVGRGRRRVRHIDLPTMCRPVTSAAAAASNIITSSIGSSAPEEDVEARTATDEEKAAAGPKEERKQPAALATPARRRVTAKVTQAKPSSELSAVFREQIPQ